jgi:hypothetical protein
MLAAPLAASAAGKGSARLVFFGEVESCPSDGGPGLWSIGGREVTVAETTRFVETWGEAGVGAFLLVNARVLEDGTLEAALIHVQPPFFRSVCRFGQTVAQRVAFRQQGGLQSQERTQAQTRDRLRTQEQTQTRLQLQDQTCSQEQDRARTQTQQQLRDQSCLQDQARTQTQERLQDQTRTMTQDPASLQTQTLEHARTRARTRAGGW